MLCWIFNYNIVGENSATKFVFIFFVFKFLGPDSITCTVMMSHLSRWFQDVYNSTVFFYISLKLSIYRPKPYLYMQHLGYNFIEVIRITSRYTTEISKSDFTIELCLIGRCERRMESTQFIQDTAHGPDITLLIVWHIVYQLLQKKLHIFTLLFYNNGIFPSFVLYSEYAYIQTRLSIILVLQFQYLLCKKSSCPYTW